MTKLECMVDVTDELHTAIELMWCLKLVIDSPKFREDGNDDDKALLHTIVNKLEDVREVLRKDGYRMEPNKGEEDAI